MKIDFNSDTHEYFIDGVKVWSVTQILNANGLNDFSNVQTEVLEAARQFGTNIHKTIEYYEDSSLIIDALDPTLASYLKVWRQFKRETKFKTLAIEQIVASAKYLYAGRFDLLGRLNDKLTIADIKTGVCDKKTIGYTGMQTGGYELAYNEDKKAKDLVKQRLGIWLTEKGYKIELYKNKMDINNFKSCLNVANLKLKLGIGG